MCVKLKGSGIKPGSILGMQLRTGKASGLWGFRNGAQYNVRLESLSTTWKKYQQNRGVITVDSFWEKDKLFTRSDGKPFQIGVIYNDDNEFAVITMDANDIVSPFHHRMPLTLSETGVEEFLNMKDPIVLPVQEFKLVA